jgi:hypothetical protein
MYRSLFIVLFLCSTVSLLAQPKIKVEEGTSLDFGDVYTGLKADKILTIKNMGNDTLRITDVHAQCGCTAAMMKDEDKKLAPGQSGKLSISFDTHNYPGLKVTKQVYISSNDTSNAKLTISFNVNVMNILDVKPNIISFNESKMESTYTKTVTISNPGKESIKILSVGTAFDQVKVEMGKMQLMPGESTQLQAVFHPKGSGTFQGDIDIMTDNKALPKLTVKLYAWVTRK